MVSGPPGSAPATRTGTRAAAYRPATWTSASPTSTSSCGRGLASSPARASTSRSSTRALSRSTSGSRSSGSSPPSLSRAATSSWVRMLASGLRSSCAASATKALLVPGGRQPGEHAVEGRGECADLVAGRWHGQPLGRWPRRRSARRHGAAPRPAAAPADHPPCERGQRHEEQREEHEQERAQGRAGSSRGPPSGRPPPRVRARPARADPGHDEVPRQPGPAARDGDRAPRDETLGLLGVTSGVRRSAVADAHDPVSGVEHLHHLAARHRHGVGQPAGLDQDGDLTGGGRASSTAARSSVAATAAYSSRPPVTRASATPATPRIVSRERRLRRDQAHVASR